MKKEILVKLYKYCAYQDRCASEIREKLAEWEVSETEWPGYLNHLAAERFWDEERYAASIVRGKFAYKHWGRIKIRQALRAKQVPQELIEHALKAEIESDAYQATLATLARKKWQQLGGKDSLEIRTKLYRHLTQKGYENSVIKEVLDGLLT